MCAGIMIVQKGAPMHSAKTIASTHWQSYRLMYMFKHLLDHSSVGGEQLVQCAACTAVYKQQACFTVNLLPVEISGSFSLRSSTAGCCCVHLTPVQGVACVDVTCEDATGTQQQVVQCHA